MKRARRLIVMSLFLVGAAIPAAAEARCPNLWRCLGIGIGEGYHAYNGCCPVWCPPAVGYAPGSWEMVPYPEGTAVPTPARQARRPAVSSRATLAPQAVLPEENALEPVPDPLLAPPPH
jgi:hypothetical protein